MKKFVLVVLAALFVAVPDLQPLSFHMLQATVGAPQITTTIPGTKALIRH